MQLKLSVLPLRRNRISALSAYCSAEFLVCNDVSSASIELRCVFDIFVFLLVPFFFNKKLSALNCIFSCNFLGFLVYSYGNIHFSCNFLRFWCIMFLKCMIRFPLSDETAEFIEQCCKNIDRFSSYS